MSSGCASLKKYVAQQPEIDCKAPGGESPEVLCEAPVIESQNKMQDSELADVENRHRWADCIRKHKELVMCLNTLRKAGVIK